MSASAAIVAWLMVAINTWAWAPVPASQAARAAETRARAADSIVAVAYDVDEPPVTHGAWARARTALLLASIESLESRFLERVLNGHCAKPECDNGAAWSGFQIHLGRHGLRLTGDGKATQCFIRAADCFGAQELTDDWTLAAKAGLHIYRTEPRQYSTLAPATQQAKEWLRAHPVPVEDAEVMAQMRPTTPRALVTTGFNPEGQPE